MRPCSDGARPAAAGAADAVVAAAVAAIHAAAQAEQLRLSAKLGGPAAAAAKVVLSQIGAQGRHSTCSQCSSHTYRGIKGPVRFVLKLALPPFSPPLSSGVQILKQNMHRTLDILNTSTPVQRVAMQYFTLGN